MNETLLAKQSVLFRTLNYSLRPFSPPSGKMLNLAILPFHRLVLNVKKIKKMLNQN